LPTVLQRETIRLLKRRGCGESVLSCLPRGDRAGCDLVGCSQRRAGAGGSGICHAPLYAGRRLGRLVYFEDEPGRRSAAKLLKLSFKKDGTCATGAGPVPPASAPPCQAASEMANLVCRLDSAYDNCATAAKIIPTTPRSQVNIAKPTGAAPQRLNRPSPVSYEQVITIVRNRRSLRTRGGD